MNKKISVPYHLHISRVIFASLCIVAVGILHVPVNAVLPIAERSTSAPAVLAYATSINRSDLVAGTNSSRAANSLGALNENSKLNVSAQLKANDMIANNYWAHTSPNGTQPWYWFTQAGYDYTSAGENLAYGFSTSDAVVTGWMNSAGHRANILGNYKDVGHGIANGENYQGNQNTVVVAHYGTERNAASASTPAPAPAASTTPAPTTTPTPSATAQPSQSPAATPVTPTTQQTPTSPAPAASNDTPVTQQTAPTTPKTTPSKSTPAPTSTASATQTSSLPAWQLLLRGQAPLLVIVSLSILVIAGAGYMATHVSLVRRAIATSERYVLHHPVADVSIFATATAIVLLTTVIGRIG